MKKLTADFWPLSEPTPCKNGSELLGYAKITIAGGIELNDISVFRRNDGELSLDFPGFGENGEYVIPKSKEAFAAMRDVVAMAVDDQQYHFGYNQGEYGFKHSKEHPTENELKVSGHLVKEPYADGRFSIEVADLCTLYGITTDVRDGSKGGHFLAVYMPTVSNYEKDGEKVYVPAFQGIEAKWKGKDGTERSFDYNRLLAKLVGYKRRNLMRAQKPALEDAVKDADTRRKSQGADMPGKEKEPVR